MKMNEMFPKNFLAKEDIVQPTTATIRSVTQEEVAGDGGKELKAVIHFNGNLKQMILNRGNAQTLCDLYGDDSTAWHGRQIEIYVDPSVMFAGKRVGGLRLRPPGANGYGQRPPVSMPQAIGGELWDISDGKSVMAGKTAEQIREIIGAMDPAAFKVKPAGSPREMAKPADQYGFGSVPQTSGDEIPF